MPPPVGQGTLSDDARLTSVCLSRTSGLSREQKGHRKTKIGTQVAHVTRDLDTTFNLKKSKFNLQGAVAYCGGLLHSLFIFLRHEDPAAVPVCRVGTSVRCAAPRRK